MTTEQCSVDSLLPKNRTETFARQLQNRLRTLSAESERDGLEDTSWNGDQLSSSSDNDIYYDLDSFPGSPAEEATDNNFPDYISVKNSDCNLPSSSGANFLNCNELNGNDKVDCRYLGQIYTHDNLNNCKNINVGSTRFSSNTSEKERASCDQCSTSQNLDCVSLPQLSDTSGENNYSSSCLQNGFLDSSQSLNEPSDSTNKINSSDEINGFNHLNSLQRLNENSRLDNSSKFNNNNINRPVKAVQEANQEIPGNHTNSENSENQENKENLNECCTCDKSGDSVSVDVNCNSSYNNSNIYVNNSDSPEKDSEMTVQSSGSSSINEEQSSGSKGIPIQENMSQVEEKESESSSKNIKCNSLQYTEGDLCRLVDAVFSKSQDEQYSSSTEADCKSSNQETDKNDNNEEEVESIESKRSKFRRSSSLKTGKTPPGTPGRKKIVRFADVLGLDLADVRTFLDEIPRVPKSAYVDLHGVELSSSPPVHMSPLDHLGQGTVTSLSPKALKTIVPLFQQPSSRPDFLYRVRDNCVCLENAIISDPVLSVITGIVRVKNIDFHKSVHIRYSIDNWKSYADLQGKYVPNSCDGFSDKFSFMLYAHMLSVGQRLEFAIRYHTKGSLFWDNNFGANYAFQCVPDGPSKFSSSTYLSRPTETWATFY